MSKQENRTDTPQRILDSAEKLFAQQGFHGTSTRQIAAEAGISIQTLHYHCENKLNLYHMVLKRSVIPVTHMIDNYVKEMFTQDISEDRVIRKYTDIIIDELFNIVTKHPNYAPLFLRQWLERDPELRRVEQEDLMPSIGEWVRQAEATVNEDRRSGIDLPLVLLSLSWIYWGLNVSPQFIGTLLEVDPESLEYKHRLKKHAKNITERILGTRLSDS